MNAREECRQQRRPADLKVDVSELLSMRSNGATQSACAKKYGVNVRVIRRILDSNGAPRSIVVGMTDVCPVCKKEYRKDRSSRITCSMLCASRLAANPLAEEEEMVKRYLTGMTQDEIAREVGISQKSVCKALRRAGVKCRKKAKRDQRGEKNHMWIGNSVGYKTAHNRVRSQRGAPLICDHCGKAAGEASLEWANISGNYPDPNDYISLCVKCHRKWDSDRRRKNV